MMMSTRIGEFARLLLRWVLALIVLLVSLWAVLLYSPEKEEEGRTVLEFAIWGGVAERTAWEAIIEDFERKNPDVKVKLLLIPVRYSEKILAMLAANIAPDLFNMPIAEVTHRDVLLPVDDYLAQDTTFDADAFLPGLLNLGRFRGRQYSIVSSAGPLALFYNVEHFRESELPTPNEFYARGEWNWATFLQVCKRLVKRDANGRVERWGYRLYAEWIIWEYIFLNGGQPFDEEFRKFNYDDPLVYEPLQRLADLALVHEVAPRFAPEEAVGSSTWQDFKSGRLAMFTSGPWMLARLKGMEDEYDIAPPPMEPGGRTMVGGGSVSGIWKKSKHKEAAYRWMRHQASEEARIMWARLGFDLPGHRRLAEHPELWADSTITPKHFSVFYEILPPALQKPIAVNPFIPEKATFQVTRNAWEAIRMGRMTARKALLHYGPIVNRIIETGR